MDIAQEAERLRRLLEEQDQAKVKIALFGQPGAGKSSLINALIGKKVAPVGVRVDCTEDKTKFEHSGLEFWDLPGYGTERFPAETFWERFGIPTFDLFLCVFDGKFHRDDGVFFRRLLSESRAVILVRQKHDALWQDDLPIETLEAEVVQDARAQTGIDDIDVCFVSTRRPPRLADLERAIQAKLDLAKADRWARSAKAWSHEALERKRGACERYVYAAAAVAAANALNPIPNLDIAIDLAAMRALFARIRTAYGLEDERLESTTSLFPLIKPLVDRVLHLATKDGLLALARQLAKPEAVKGLAKYVPIVGQVAAATIGFGLTVKVGEHQLEVCHAAASKILDMELSAGR